jgi:HSP20 family protein
MTMLEPVAPWLRELNRLVGGGDMPVAAFIPPADVIVTDQGVNVDMDVPGIPRENLDIELESNTLTVRGERPFPYAQETSERAWRHIERRFGRFERSLRVPGGLDPESVQASLQDGVLSIRVPRPASAQPRHVEIRAGGGTGGTIEGQSGQTGQAAGQPGQPGQAGQQPGASQTTSPPGATA